MDIAHFGWWLVLGFILLYAFGVWLGNRGSIIVYRNYNDVMIVGLLVIIPSVAFGVVTAFGGDEELMAMVGVPVTLITLALTGITLVAVIIRTFLDNRNPLKALLAIYVKLPTGIMFFVHLINIFTGDNRKQRRQSVFWTLIMVPLLYGLVYDKSKGKLPRTYR